MITKLADSYYIQPSNMNSQTEHNNSDIDPTYEMFLQHLRVDGNSYVLEMNEDNGLPIFVKYEREMKLEAQTSLNCQSEKGCSLVDESYKTFLDCLRFEDNSMILEFEPGVSVTYEAEEKEASAGSKSLVTETTICARKHVLIPYRNNCPSDLTVYEDKNRTLVSLSYFDDFFEFKKKLMVILSKPYDQKEYEELMKEATDRRPRHRHRDLRSGSRPYTTAEMGRSYLDHHPDLARQIESADCHRRLDLLRGFFFWLENLCHLGAFKPWTAQPFSYEGVANSGDKLPLPIEIVRD